MSESLEKLVNFYETLTPERVPGFAEFYSEDAWFKDPFNEVRGLPAIESIFTHMFRQIDAPRFSVSERLVAQNGVMLVWELHYRVRLWGRGEPQVMRGVAHLRFDARGYVNYHRDYWDTGEELYAKLPGVGCIVRGLRRALSA